MADRQRRAVYAWESGWRDWNTTTMGLRRAREYVCWACDMYNLCAPRVKQHKPAAYDRSYSQGDLISFRDDEINAAAALHEAAHYITGRIFGESIEGHAPEWAAVYLWLLIKARIAPRTALCASAAAKGVQWASLWSVSPKRLARRFPNYHDAKRLTAPAR